MVVDQEEGEIELSVGNLMASGEKEIISDNRKGSSQMHKRVSP